MKVYCPTKNTVILWQIRVVVMSTILCAAAVYVSFAIKMKLFLAVAIISAIFTLKALLVFWYIPIYFKGYELAINENALIIKSGVILRHERIMPEPRLVYTERYRTPLSRVLGLSGLLLRATRAATFSAELPDAYIDEILKEMLH